MNEGGGFHVTYPEAWYVHPQDTTNRVGACTHFSMEPFEVDRGDRDEVPGGGASVWLTYVHGSCIGFYDEEEILQRDELVVAGLPALRIESRLFDLPRDYRYVVDFNPPHLLGADCEDGLGLILATNEDAPGDFEVNRAVVDRMARTLRVDD